MRPSDTDRPTRRVRHPPLTHLPIGAIIVVAILDAISAVAGDTHPWAREMFHAGTFTLVAGTGGVLLAVASGMLDRARLTPSGHADRRAVNAHAALIAPMMPLSVIDIVLRLSRYADATHTPAVVFALSLGALTVAVLGGRLGGKLVHARHDVSVARAGAEEGNRR